MQISGSKTTRRALTSLIVGALLIFFVYALFSFSDMPQESDLKWLPSSNVANVENALRRGQAIGIWIISRDDVRIYVDSQSRGYAALRRAMDQGKGYAVGYTQSREMFSDSPQLYSFVHAITADGVPVLTFQDGVKERLYLSAGLMALGALLVSYAALTFVRGRRKAKAPAAESSRFTVYITARKIASLLGLAGYVVLMVAYGKEHLCKFTNGLPEPLGSLVFVLVGIVPFYALLLLAFSEELFEKKKGDLAARKRTPGARQS